MSPIHQIFTKIGYLVIPRGSLLKMQKVTNSEAGGFGDIAEWNGTVKLEFDRGYSIEFRNGALHQKPGVTILDVLVYDAGDPKIVAESTADAQQMLEYLLENHLSDVRTDFEKLPTRVVDPEIPTPCLSDVVKVIRTGFEGKQFSSLITSVTTLGKCSDTPKDPLDRVDIEIGTDISITILNDLHDRLLRRWRIVAKVATIGPTAEVSASVAIAMKALEEIRYFLLDQFPNLEHDQSFRLNYIEF